MAAYLAACHVVTLPLYEDSSVWYLCYSPPHQFLPLSFCGTYALRAPGPHEAVVGISVMGLCNLAGRNQRGLLSTGSTCSIQPEETGNAPSRSLGHTSKEQNNHRLCFPSTFLKAKSCSCLLARKQLAFFIVSRAPTQFPRVETKSVSEN